MQGWRNIEMYLSLIEQPRLSVHFGNKFSSCHPSRTGTLPTFNTWLPTLPCSLPSQATRRGEEPVGEIHPLLKSLTSHSAGENWMHGPTYLQRGGWETPARAVLLLGLLMDNKLSPPISRFTVLNLDHWQPPGSHLQSSWGHPSSHNLEHLYPRLLLFPSRWTACPNLYHCPPTHPPLQSHPAWRGYLLSSSRVKIEVPGSDPLPNTAGLFFPSIPEEHASLLLSRACSSS